MAKSAEQSHWDSYQVGKRHARRTQERYRLATDSAELYRAWRSLFALIPRGDAVLAERLADLLCAAVRGEVHPDRQAQERIRQWISEQ